MTRRDPVILHVNGITERQWTVLLKWWLMIGCKTALYEISMCTFVLCRSERSLNDASRGVSSVDALITVLVYESTVLSLNGIGALAIRELRFKAWD